jgi:hypothetical protein
MHKRYILASVSYSLYVPLFIHAYPCDIQVSQAFNGVIADLDTLVNLLESIEFFLKRLDIYTKTPTPAMTEIVVKILVELLSIFALVTKQIRQGRTSEFVFAEPEVLSDSMECREVCKEALRRELRPGGSSEARPTYSGRGSDGDSADA